MTTDKGNTNAKTDDGKAKTTAAEANKSQGASSSAESRKAATNGAEDTAKDTAQNSQASGKSSGRDELMFRGVLMAIIMRLPPALAYGSHAKTLDDMMRYVDSFDTREERQVVVEMIRSIAEVDIGALPSGAYQGRVDEAMRVVYGLSDQVPDNIRDPHSQAAAAERLNYSLSGLPMPPEHQALEGKQQAGFGEATDEQKAAAARLAQSAAPS